MLWKYLLITLGIGALIYLILAFSLFWLQHRFIFYPVSLDKEHRFSGLRPHQEVWLEHNGQPAVHGLYFERSGAERLLLFFHGNAGALDKWGYAANEFLDQGLNVFIIDYRGYGKSKGEITDEGLKNDALLAYQWACARFASQDIILCGRSLGSGLATWLSRKYPSRLLLLETPYTSLQDMAALNFAWLPLTWLMRFELNNLEWVQQSMAPVYIIHGTRDKLIPYRMAQQVAQSNGQLFTISGAGHNDLANFEAYHESLRKIFHADE